MVCLFSIKVFHCKDMKVQTQSGAPSLYMSSYWPRMAECLAQFKQSAYAQNRLVPITYLTCKFLTIHVLQYTSTAVTWPKSPNTAL